MASVDKIKFLRNVPNQFLSIWKEENEYHNIKGYILCKTNASRIRKPRFVGASVSWMIESLNLDKIGTDEICYWKCSSNCK